MFKINTDGFKTAAGAFREGSQQLHRNESAIDDIRHMISNLSDMEDVVSVLYDLKTDVRKEGVQETALYETGLWIARRYDDCEDEIITNMDNTKFEISVPQYTMTGFSRNSRTGRKINTEVLNEILDLFH